MAVADESSERDVNGKYRRVYGCACVHVCVSVYVGVGVCMYKMRNASSLCYMIGKKGSDDSQLTERLFIEIFFQMFQIDSLRGPITCASMFELRIVLS